VLARPPKKRPWPRDANAMQTHMRTHRWRIGFAPLFACDWLCNSACQSRVQSPESRARAGLLISPTVDSPSLSRADAQREVWSVLKAAVDGLCENDFGRPWPAPRGDAIARALAKHDPDLCVQAARDTREIVQSQDRAPNITALFEKKLRDLAEVRDAVRGALADVGEGEPCL
jgi:hypothetical protein